MHTLSIKVLSSMLSKGEISCVELTKFFLKRIKQYNKQLNCIITVTENTALQDAEQADKQIKSNDKSLLTGIPILHKDNFCTENIKTSCGSKMLDNFISPYDASIVNKLKKSGVIMLGKTNMDEFAMGASNENSFYGPVRNPWDKTRVPGGSSGGSAAAVAACIIPGATGTDTGGSIRQPASFCGVTGIKPTYGRVSRYGMIAFASSLDQGGIIAKTAEDCAILLENIAGFDAKDSTSIDIPVPNYSANIDQPIHEIRIGVAKEFLDDRLHPEIAISLDNTIKNLEALGATVKFIQLPNAHLAIPAYYIIAPAECSSNLARYDGVRYGYRCQNPNNLEDFYIRNRTEGFGDEVKRRIIIGTYVLSSGYYNAYYLKAQKIRQLIYQDYKSAFDEVDIILAPTTPNTAFKLGAKSDNPVAMYSSDIYTSSINLAGLPALSMPAGYIEHLPFGVQLIGNHFAEEKILNVAHKFQQETNWHQQHPGDKP